MPRAETRSEFEPQAGTRGRFVIRDAREAINETERLLCGSAAVTRPAVAEGLALAGRPAATLLVPSTAGPTGSHTASAEAAWVHHRSGSGSSTGFAFELAGSIAQDVVDQCLVAHDLARRTGLPGLCTYEPAGTDRLAPVRLPDAPMLDAFRRGVEAGEGGVAAEAVRAFEHVTALTGRAISAVTSEGPEDASFAIVASAASRELATSLARLLAQGEVTCRVVSIHLIRPFPTETLSTALAGLTASVMIPAGDGELDGALPLVSTVLPAPDRSTSLESRALELLGAARQAFGLPDAPAPEIAPAPATDTIGWTARPAGSWAEHFLLDAAARLETIDEVSLGNGSSTLIVGPNASPDLPAGLAICAHPEYVQDRTLLDSMAVGATLLIASACAVPDGWWDDLAEETRVAILERELSLHWIDLGDGNPDLTDPDTVRDELLQAFLSRGGRPLDPKALESSRLGREPDFEPAEIPLPVMPEQTTESEPGDETDAWRDASRHFHLTGDGAHSAAEPTSAEPLNPLVLAAMDAAARQGERYPLLIGGGRTVPFEARVTEVLAQFEDEREPATILGHHLSRLSNSVGRVASRKAGPTETGPILDEALEEFRRGLELSEAAAMTLQREAARLRERLISQDHASNIVSLGKTTLLCLHVAAVAGVRRERRARLVEEIDGLVQRLDELLAVDASHETSGKSAEALEATFGADAGDLFDPAKLAASLPAHRGSVRLGPERRARIENTLATLRDSREMDRETDLVVLRPEDGTAADSIPGVRTVTHPRGLGASIGLFDGIAERYTALFRALRVARLEVDSAYDPTLHDVPLARFDWQGMQEDELLSLPRLVVLETAERLRGAGLGAFAELLRSGRPVHVLVEQSTSEFGAAETWQGLGGFHPGLGYLAIAHREAFVVESSLVCPERLSLELEKMATSLRPGAALIAAPAWNATVPAWIQLLAAEQARAVPCFTYDPEAGQHWAERFNLAGNPQPDLPWPLHPVRYRNAKGKTQTLEQPFTFAHAVALDPAYREHFRIVPEQAWSDEQMELGDYLAAPIAAVDRKIPFIWVVGDGKHLARALVTRDLAHASRDRLRAWRILQELAGTDNEYARRAAAAAREALHEQHAGEVDRVRSEAAGEAMNRLARVLMDFDGPLPASTAPAAPPAGSSTAPAPEAPATEAAPAAAAPAEDVSFDAPWIESALCTSCQDCININNRLFKYDANKQAFVADASAGTFEQLVRAAEKCPARCIHPGRPAPGDTSATDGVMSRAAKFN
jgi:ferredoxin